MRERAYLEDGGPTDPAVQGHADPERLSANNDEYLVNTCTDDDK